MQMKIRTYKGKIDLEDYFKECREFHGFLAPGLVLGGFMVDLALESIDQSRAFDAIVETRKCLPDALQILTQCSIGNGWLRILDWGKLAITLYDIETNEGVRVHLDFKKLVTYPLVKAWAFKEKSKKDNPLEPLIEEFIKAGRNILTSRKVKIESIHEMLACYDQPKLCIKCGEAFRHGSGDFCQGCREPFFRML